VVFRGGGAIAPERQVEITGWFGQIGANSDGQGRPWTVLHNDDPAGSRELPFHCDISYMQFPIEGISLHPQSLPGGETSTSFVSNAQAWDALPLELQQELRGRKGRHYYASGQLMNFDWPVFEHWHPICLEHPKTGRPLLFVTEHHVDRIEGMSDQRSAEVLQELFARLYAPERQYEHVWREGDLLIWDNLAVQHARTRAAEPSEGVRALQRVALGKVGFLEQLEELKQRQAAQA
jgi:taurine dioxygenase